MGAINGTLTYKVFYVQGQPEEGWQERFVERVRQNAFKALTPEGEEETSVGWVPVSRPLHVDFDIHTILYDHFINIALRQDKYALPTSLLKAHLEEAELEYMMQHGKERLSKFEREDIKVMVKRRLKERQLPRMKVTDMSWDLRGGRVRFWNQSNTLCELFQGYFEDTFGLKLRPANPYVDALELGLSPEQVETLNCAEPSTFVDVTTL